MVSGMPSIVNIDENNICNIIVENCAPYDVTLERDDILGVMETETDELVPLTEKLLQNFHTSLDKLFRIISPIQQEQLQYQIENEVKINFITSLPNVQLYNTIEVRFGNLVI